MKNKEVKDGFNEMLLYTTPNGKVKVEIYLQNETIWLTQQKIADLLGVDRTVVTKHIGNIFKEGELKEEVVCAIFAHTTQHGAIKGKTQETWVQKLDAFLQFNEEAVLKHQGKVSHEVASALAGSEFEKFRIIQDQLLESDFDKVVKKLSESKTENKKLKKKNDHHRNK